MTKYVVTAPYVTCKVNDLAGATVVGEFYQGAVLPGSAEPDNVARLLGKGMVAEQGTPEAELLGVPAGTPIPGEPPNVPVTEQSPASITPADRQARAQEAADRAARQVDRANGRPAGNASRDDWAAYATGKGAPAEETKPVDEGGLSRDDLRAKYGA